MFCKIFLFSAVLLAAEAQRQELVFQDGNYVLGWEVNPARTFITVDALVKTTGYVAFGVSNRDGPGMADSDIIIAGFDPIDGVNYFGDFYATQRDPYPPTLDTRQDGQLLEVREEDGTTFVKFTRLLVTGDPNSGQDVDISADTFLLWAYGTGDIVDYHLSNRGKVAQSLLAPAPTPTDRGIPSRLPKMGV